MRVTKDTIHQVKKVCVIGPECTGKTELSRFLGEHYQTTWVEEYARAYLNKLNRPYEQFDLTKIAHGQLRMEDEWAYDANRVLICDTNVLVVKIWSEFKFGNCDEEILRKMNERKYDLYLLTYIDIPWQEDPQREHPDKREQLWKIYRDELATMGAPVVEIAGSREERQKKAIEAINKIL
jgi:NadR type nicotinamide-nucleotide adenylyltransferase